MNWKVDHLADRNDRDIPDDPSTDPEGAKKRAERPHIQSAYVQDMMEYEPRTNRWVPAPNFIAQKAQSAKRLYERISKQAKPIEGEEAEALDNYFALYRDRMEQGPFSGFLYDNKDLLLKRIVSALIWMEHSEDIRASGRAQGREPDQLKASQEAIERNEIALQFFCRALNRLEVVQEQIALTDFAWQNAAKQASWDFLGFHKRNANNPERSSERDQKRRSAEEMMFGDTENDPSDV